MDGRRCRSRLFANNGRDLIRCFLGSFFRQCELVNISEGFALRLRKSEDLLPGFQATDAGNKLVAQRPVIMCVELARLGEALELVGEIDDGQVLLATLLKRIGS